MKRDPPRLFEDPSIGDDVRSDLAEANREWMHRTDLDAAHSRFIASAAASSHGAIGLWTWVTAGGVALVALGLGTAAYLTMQKAPAATSVAANPPIVVPVIPPVAPPLAVESAPPIAAPAITARPRRERVRREPAAVAISIAPIAPPPPIVSPLADLERETALMSRQRHEAQTGNPSTALDLAGQAAREFPHGHFLVEREAWRLVALDRLGRRDEVRAGAARFVEQHPRTPQTEMVRRLLTR